MFGYYIGFGGSAYSNGNVDFMRFSASGNYRKSGLFGHGWREGNWNFEGYNTSYQGGNWVSAASVPSFFQRYVLDIAVSNNINKNGVYESAYFYF